MVKKSDTLEWLTAAARPEIRESISTIHESVAKEVRRRKPLCLASGACCHFDAFDHRLYATGLEAALCAQICAEEGHGIDLKDLATARTAGGCPWQTGRLCTARAGRPVGCRVFYCDPRASEWVPELAEWAHGAIKELHQELGVPYVYGEWRDMLELVICSEERA